MNDCNLIRLNDADIFHIKQRHISIEQIEHRRQLLNLQMQVGLPGCFRRR